MNKIYSTKYGRKAIDEMNVKGVMYEVTTDLHPKLEGGGGAYQSNNNGTGGTIYLNDNASSVDLLAHEMFHGYQDFHGQSPSIQNEVEARLFAESVGYEHMMSSPVDGGRGPQLLAFKGDIPQVFNYNVEKIMKNYEDYRMHYLVVSFKSHFGGYENLPLTTKNQKSLIKHFINN
jgi:hypothetical protein